jgi:hypothetical protein
LKPRERERVRKDRKVEVKRKTFGGKRGTLYICRERRSTLFEGTQAMSARPSDKDRLRVKALGWWVVKA